MFLAQDVVDRSLEELGLLDIKNVNIYKVSTKFSRGNINDVIKIEAKNNLLIHLMESQKLSPTFEITIQNQCKHCQGRGFHTFLFTTEFVKCKLQILHQNGRTIYEGCNGTGHKITRCNKCQGTGKIGENPCPTCFDQKTKQSKGTFIHWKTNNPNNQIKCLKCGGMGKIKKLVQRETEIKRIDVCKKCNGTGINTNIGSPVLSLSTAEILKSLLPPK